MCNGLPHNSRAEHEAENELMVCKQRHGHNAVNARCQAENKRIQHRRRLYEFLNNDRKHNNQD